MDQSKPSRTSDIPAVMRALHQVRDEDPKILVDPIAPRLVDVATNQAWLAPLLNHPFAPQWRAGFLIRNRYAEDCLAEAVRRGASQYLILGAGLDTFAYRQPDWAGAIGIIEADHPATQAAKRQALADAGIATPPNLIFAPIDFETTTLAEGLLQTRFDFAARTFCALLGVTQYLTREAIEATLGFVLSLPIASEIVLSFILPQEDLSGVEADAVAVAAERAADAGEPWLSRYRPEELAGRLRQMGYRRTERLAPEDAQARYLRGRSDDLKARVGEQLIRAIV